MTEQIRSALPAETIAEALPNQSTQAHIPIDEVAAEVTQAKRRIQRAMWGEKVENPNGSPVHDELREIFKSIAYFQLTHNMRDMEPADDA